MTQEKEDPKQDERVPLDFVSCFVHDARSPLVTIIAAIDNLEDLGLMRDPAEVLRISKTIRSQARRIGRRMDEVSEYSRTLAGNKEMFPRIFNFWECFDEVVPDFDSRKEDVVFHDTQGYCYPVTFRGELCERRKREPIEAYGDKVLTRIVLFNLFGNAVKYSPPNPHGERKIDFDVVTDPEAVKFWVQNDCERRVPEELYPRLFEKEFTLPEHRDCGTGLGLYFCERMIRLQNGKISVESGLTERGPYARFSFTLPKPPES